MKKNVNENNSAVPKQKERHLVSWTPEEDDLLRNLITKHGTENWSIIASKFEDKTTRQCRRRWYSYLNSDFKKGGWSPEEDMLLCETQKIFGNKWTEIAKVVSGRTDNAVKNRFSTLCKKRAKHEASTAETSNSFINVNNKRVIFLNGPNNEREQESVVLTKKTRTDISTASETYSNGGNLVPEYVIVDRRLKSKMHEYSPSSSDYSTGSTLYCQAEGHRTEISHAENCALKMKIVEAVLQSTSTVDKIGFGRMIEISCVPNTDEVETITGSESVQGSEIFLCEHTEMEFSSPIIETPIFRSLTASVPTPKFSESERQFLLKTLGFESTSPKPTANPTQHPPSKRVLLHSLCNSSSSLKDFVALLISEAIHLEWHG